MFTYKIDKYDYKYIFKINFYTIRIKWKKQIQLKNNMMTVISRTVRVKISHKKMNLRLNQRIQKVNESHLFYEI